MPKSSVLQSLSPFKKSTRRFGSFYAEWFRTLQQNLLPRLIDSITSPFSPPADLIAASEAVHRHFCTYYAALDLAATADQIAVLLNPPWRTALEKPFIFLGDLHPYLFTNLLRSFFQVGDDDDGAYGHWKGSGGGIVGGGVFMEKQWQIETAWRSRSNSLMPRIQDLERGLRLMVPALTRRVTNAQAALVTSMAAEGRVDAAAATAQMEELASVFRDANRLRRSAISEIVSATTTYQAALFLKALAQFLVGLGDLELLQKFENGKISEVEN